MKLIGCLVWFDEQPGFLATAVTSLGKFCDIVVAVDGRYDLFPGNNNRSSLDQVDAIVQTAEAVDLECLLYRPKTCFVDNEVGKRNLSLALAGSVAEPDEDWLVIFDADVHLMKVDREKLLSELDKTDKNVATLTTMRGRDVHSPEFDDVDLAHEFTVESRLLYRYHPSLRYGPAHWAVSRDKARKKIWLWGNINLAPALDLGDSLVVYHRTRAREAARSVAAGRYYMERDRLAVETSNAELFRNRG